MKGNKDKYHVLISTKEKNVCKYRYHAVDQ